MNPAPVPLRYRLTLALLSPALIGYTVLRARRDGGWRYLKQRLGFDLPALARPIWLHCASVGEVNAALPLIDGLLDHHPEVPLLVTTNTPTGAAVLQQKRGERMSHAYLPLDALGATRRFIRRLRPRASLILETELWPTLYHAAATNGAPVQLVNARLSEKTLGAKPWLREAYRSCLANSARVLARGEADAAGYRELGAPADKVSVIGNIKFALGGGPVSDAQDFVGRPYLLAASTHDDEELQLARAWQQIERRGHLLVIAPRHPERREAILRQLAPLGLEIAVRSRGDTIRESTDLYLADTLGELQHFIAHAALVCMGGSLIPRGGQNLLEPARAGRAILCGPHMENFAAEMATFVAAAAVAQLADPSQLAAILDELLGQPAQREALGQRALALMQRDGDIASRYLDQLDIPDA